MITLLCAAGAAVVAVALRVKARRWDPTADLRAAQRKERLDAPEIVRVMSTYFDRLDLDSDGTVRIDALDHLDQLEAPDRDKELLQQILSEAGPRCRVITNPYLLGDWPEYQYEPIGKLLGFRSVTVAAGTSAGLSTMLYDVKVEDYGISRADLDTYIARVNARPTI